MEWSKFVSNVPAALSAVPEHRLLSAYTKSDASTLLGMVYNHETDMYSINIKDFAAVKYTKRGLLSLVSSLWDPMGLSMPSILFFRLLLQQLWMLKLGWDEQIPQDLAKKFEAAIAELPALAKLSFPRWISSEEQSIIELIGFSDACFSAYGACVYARVRTAKGFVVSLLSAKAHVAPLKTALRTENKSAKIPKLELDSFLLLAALITDIKNALGTNAVVAALYVDSSCILAWFRNNRSTLKYVKVRVARAREFVSPSQVHHVPGKQNPADIVSRGCSPAQLLSESLYLHGPVWLKDEVLPRTPSESLEDPESSPIVLATTTAQDESEN
jgi:hypothetical protein